MSNDLNQPVTIALTTPIKVSGVDVNVLQMRRPTMAQQIAARMASRDTKMVAEQEDLHMFASLCSVQPNELLALDMADYLHMVEVFANFLKRPPMKSANSSASTPAPSQDGLAPTS
jgi:hypothetical protein